MEVWQDRGIPLHIVIRSIESVFDVFDKLPAGTRTIKSLFYCREEIEVQYNEWLASQVGRSDDSVTAVEQFSADMVTAHIDGSIAALKAVSIHGMQEDIARAISRLNELGADLTSDFETVDKTLGAIEKLLDRSMLTNWEPEHLKLIKKEIGSQLREYKVEMEAETYKNTFDLMLLKRLREGAGIPRLGLFYL